jgi:hypothetical protein
MPCIFCSDFLDIESFGEFPDDGFYGAPNFLDQILSI